MDFFEEVDGLGIVEQHIQGVLKLEAAKAKLMLRRYREVRQELRDRLSRTRADTFTAQQMRGVLAQVEGAIIAMNSSLKGEMETAANELALEGVEDLVSEIERFDEHFTGAVVPINLNAQVAALETSNFLLTKYSSSIDAYGEDLIRQITGNLTQSALMQQPYGNMIRDLSNFFEGEQWKLERIARTELHNVYNLGKMNGMGELISQDIVPDLMKTLIHPMDARTAEDSKLAARLDLIVPVDAPFEYRWKGEIRRFMAPPDRPNDRAILVPYRKAWK
jgi:hypothetical protein